MVQDSRTEDKQAQWLRAAGPQDLDRLRPYLTEFRQLLDAETKALIGSSKSPVVEAFVEQHRETLEQAESECIQQAVATEGPLQQLLFEYYQSMGARESGVTRMSRVLPVCLSELMPGFDRNALVRIIRANVWGYEALRIQDDFLDEPDRVRPEWILLCGLFYRWCTEIYCQLAPDLSRFFADYAQYHDGMTNAILTDRDRTWSFHQFQREDLKSSGQMAGLVRLCATTMLRYQGQVDLIPALEEHLDAYLACRQLLDDLQDFESDVARQRGSVPIMMLWEALGGERVAAPMPDLLHAGFLILPVVPRCLKLLRELTERGLQTISSFPDSILYQLMAQRMAQLDHSLRAVEQIRARVWEAVAGPAVS